MIKRLLLKNSKKKLDAAGAGDLPDAIGKLLDCPSQIIPVITYVILSRVGIFDAVGFYFFLNRIATKLKPRGKQNAKSAK